jgi:hypothetical protein
MADSPEALISGRSQATSLAARCISTNGHEDLHRFILACGLGFIALARVELYASSNDIVPFDTLASGGKATSARYTDEATIGEIVSTAFMETTL